MYVEYILFYKADYYLNKTQIMWKYYQLNFA